MTSMKKFLSVIVIAVSLASCGGGSSDAKTDSAAVAPIVDSTNAAIDSTANKADSAIKATADTAKAAVGAVADSAKKAK